MKIFAEPLIFGKKWTMSLITLLALPKSTSMQFLTLWHSILELGKLVCVNNFPNSIAAISKNPNIKSCHAHAHLGLTMRAQEDLLQTIPILQGQYLAPNLYIKEDCSRISQHVSWIRMKDLSVEVQQVTLDVANLSGELKQVKIDVANLSGEVKQIQSDVANLSGEVQQVKTEVKQVKSDVAKIQNSVSWLWYAFSFGILVMLLIWLQICNMNGRLDAQTRQMDKRMDILEALIEKHLVKN